MGLSSRFRGALFVGLLVVAPLLLHVGHLGPGRIPYLRDLSRTHLAFKRVAVAEMRAGRLPIWNPHHLCGAPLYANPNFFHLHPISALFLVLPFATAFSFALAGLSVLMALGAGLWLRARGASTAAAIAGGAALALGGLGASLTNMYNLQASYAALPWALWSVTRWSDSGSRRHIAGLALALACCILGGEPSSWGWALAIGTGIAVARRGARAVPAIALAALLSLALSAAQLLPLMELTPQTVRGGGFTLRGSSFHSLHPIRLTGLLTPYPFGDPTRSDDWRGHDQADGGAPLFYSIYPGLTVLVLAGLGLSRRGGDRWLLLAVAIVSIALALGRYTPLFPLLWRLLPPLTQFRYPEKLLLGLFVALAALAARGLDRLGPRLRATIAGLVVIELLVAHTRLVPGVDSDLFLAPPALASDLAGHRVYHWLEAERYVPAARDRAELHIAYQEELVPPAGLPFDIGYAFDPDADALDTRRMTQLGRLVHRSPADRARLLPIAAIDRIVSGHELHYPWLEDLATPAAHVYAVHDPVARARVIPTDQIVVVRNADEAAAALAGSRFDPRRMATFEGRRPGGGGVASPTVVSRPDPATLEMVARGPGLLVVTERWLDGWSATVDGEPVAIAPANLAFIGVPLTAPGPQTVQLRYRPRTLTAGATTSLLALLVVAWLLASRARSDPDAAQQ